MRACQCIVLSLCLMGVLGVAWADRFFPRPKKAEACARLDRGNQLYNLRRFQEAIAEYEAGALIEPGPVFDYNLGQANRQLENYRAALWYYERYMNETDPGGQDPKDAHDGFEAITSPNRKQCASASGATSTDRNSRREREPGSFARPAWASRLDRVERHGSGCR